VQVTNRSFAVNPQRRIRILTQHPQITSAVFLRTLPLRTSAHPHFTGGRVNRVSRVDRVRRVLGLGLAHRPLFQMIAVYSIVRLVFGFAVVVYLSMNDDIVNYHLRSQTKKI